jgi:hypothetical protein
MVGLEGHDYYKKSESNNKVKRQDLTPLSSDPVIFPGFNLLTVVRLKKLPCKIASVFLTKII